MKPSVRLLSSAGFPSFWRRSLDEFQRLGKIAVNAEGMRKQSSLQLWDFSSSESVKACKELSDNDIGGYSEVNLQHVPATATQPGHALFSGHISNKLPQNKADVERTGYAAFRTRDRPNTLFGRSLWEVDLYEFLAMRVKTDGRKYKVNVQTDSVVYTDLHQHRLYARYPGEWETIVIRWTDFVRTNQGIVVEPQSEMLRDKVRTIGIGLTDRQAGPFEFRISKIWTTNSLEYSDLEDEHQHRLKFVPEETS